MNTVSEYEIAHQRLESRKTSKNAFLRMLIILLIMIALSAIGGTMLTCSLLPITVIIGIFTIIRGIQFYQDARPYTPSEQLVELEMMWLYGDDWQNITTVHEYTIAQDRIRKRRRDRGSFLMHLLIFIPINSGLVIIADTFTRYGENGSWWVYAITLIWSLFLLVNAVQVFAPRWMLEQRERKAGEAMRREIEKLYPEKLKQKEKLKRGVYYTLSDDGELVEMPANSLALEDDADDLRATDI